MTHPDRIELPYTDLGALLRRLREEARDPQAPLAAGSDDPRAMSLAQVAAGLDERGCRVSVAAYRDIEDGVQSPPDLVRFLAAFVACLRLGEHAHQALRVQAAFDLLRGEMGETLAQVVLAEAFEDARAMAGA